MAGAGVLLASASHLFGLGGNPSLEFIVGGGLAGLGVMDTALRFARQYAEVREIQARTPPLAIAKRDHEIDAAMKELELKKMTAEIEGPGASRLLSPEQIDALAATLNVSTAAVAHLLNRALPKAIAVRSIAANIEVLSDGEPFASALGRRRGPG